MPKYPIDVTSFIKAVEKENGSPLDKTSRDLWGLIVKLQNQAYDAGLKDGFMKQCESIAEPTAPSVKAVKLINPKLDKRRSSRSVKGWSRLSRKRALIPL